VRVGRGIGGYKWGWWSWEVGKIFNWLSVIPIRWGYRLPPEAGCWGFVLGRRIICLWVGD
jgi:hypothetical protein